MLHSPAVNGAPCPIFELCGTPRERGRAHGDQARDLIQAFVAEHFAFLEFSAAHLLGAALSREQILQHSAQYLPACERFAPDLVDEVRGIAEAAGVSFEDVFSLNTFIDIADMVRPETATNYFETPGVYPRSDVNPSASSRSAFPSGGCTSFGAMPPATRDGNVYLGQTFDTKAVFEPYVCALQISDGRDVSLKRLGPGGQDVSLKRLYIVATFAGIVGCAGINGDGVGVVINHLHTHDARPGVPFTFAVRKMLQAKNAAQASQILAQSEPASGIHYLIGDETLLYGVDFIRNNFSHYNLRSRRLR